MIEKILNNPSSGMEIEWHICSDGVYEDTIRVLAEKYPKYVRYCGKVDASRLRSLYQECDFLLMPSRFLETFGLTALEALACGTPVIGWKK